jgi:hypothetical protein
VAAWFAGEGMNMGRLVPLRTSKKTWSQRVWPTPGRSERTGMLKDLRVVRGPMPGL